MWQIHGAGGLILCACGWEKTTAPFRSFHAILFSHVINPSSLSLRFSYSSNQNLKPPSLKISPLVIANTFSSKSKPHRTENRNYFFFSSREKERSIRSDGGEEEQENLRFVRRGGGASAMRIGRGRVVLGLRLGRPWRELPRGETRARADVSRVPRSHCLASVWR